MKKLFLAAFALVLISASTKAQTAFSIAGNAGGGTTSGYKLVAGGDLQVDIPASTGLKITVSGGYENFAYKSGTFKTHASFIPLLAGAKFNLSSSLYGHAQLGYSISTVNGGGGWFTYAPSLGYMLGKSLDVSAKYLGLSKGGATLGAIVARLAYTLGK
jgi:hypothetical protein